jgi:Holliday junction resolvasome RuvABC endonuclease subunit
VIRLEELARQACPGATARSGFPQGTTAGSPREGLGSHLMSSNQPTILGLDPGTRFMGVVVLREHKLLHYAVRELRNGGRIYDLLGQARRVVFEYIERYSPQIVVIEKPYVIDSHRAATLSALVQELHERSKELGLCVQQLSPEQVRRAVVGNPRATKWEVAAALAREFPELRKHVPSKPKNPALWLRSKERYWLHAFDALAQAKATRAAPASNGRSF